MSLLMKNITLDMPSCREWWNDYLWTKQGAFASGVRPAGGSSGNVPMCRVVWYDKNGEEVTYGMPNDKDYEVGDSYFFEVDVETNLTRYFFTYQIE